MLLFLSAWLAMAGCAHHAAPTAPSATASAAALPERGGVRRGERQLTLVGPELHVGDTAPGGELRDNDNKPVTVDFADGTVRVVALVPSLDTPTCSAETRTFNRDASDLGPGVEVLVVSRDLPFAQARFCGAHGIDRVRTLSDFDTGDFSRAWGLFIKETRLAARAVAVVDGGGKVTYLQVVENVPDEPDYAAAYAALAVLAPPAPAAQPMPEAPTPDEADAAP